ncbi:MAG: hypothetical protein H7Y27_00115 [Gemmatimonadaceae bacterium]|nr:hypothetical protein [Chitinophagaceae bacterium]
MKKCLPVFLFLLAFSALRAQKVDSIYFNLYTDSLKKGTHNYINIDGKCSNGSWLPLTAKEILFVCDSGKFEGNSLFIDRNFAGEKVNIRATLKSNPAVVKEMVIYIKKKEDNERLKTPDEIFQETSKPKSRRG